MKEQKKTISVSYVYEGKSVEVKIETENLIIRSFREEDLDECISLYGDAKLTRYFDHGRPYSREEVIQLFKKGKQYFQAGKLLGLFSIFDKATLEFVGQVDIFPTSEPNTVEMGCILSRKFHNRGYALEAVKGLLIYLVDEINGIAAISNAQHPIHKVIATVHPRNRPSKKILEKLGMVLEKSGERFNAPRLWYSFYPRLPKTSDSRFFPAWNPEQYQEHSSPQQVAALSLLQKLNFSGNEDILDVGCGDGKITALLSQLVDKGHVVGIDISEKMIAYAKDKYKIENLNFEIKNAQEIFYEKDFDIIFSSFALQWLDEVDSFFNLARRALRNKGRLAATIPLNISLPLEKAMDLVMNSDKWKQYFLHIKSKHLRGENDYSLSLKKNNFVCLFFNPTTQEVTFQNRLQFENYVRQWFPYFRFIPISLQESFFQEIMNEYFLLEPLVDSMRVSYKFQRLDFIACDSL